jgi:hypothetical protein
MATTDKDFSIANNFNLSNRVVREKTVCLTVRGL